MRGVREDLSVRRLAVGACGLLVLIGCSSEGSIDTSTAGGVTTSRFQAVAGESFAVDSIGLTFELPEPFLSYIDDSYLFAASSSSPRFTFVIDAISTAAADRVAQSGETLSKLQLGAVDAVMVTDVHMEGLPSELSANEILVSNGSMSFHAIMIAVTAKLPELWDFFVRSVEVTPDR